MTQENTRGAPPPGGPVALKPGYWVALTLKPDTAPLRCYVGIVQELDRTGVRLTLVDWMTGRSVGHDFFAPWESITSALVATPESNMGLFGEAVRHWQTRMMGQDQK